MSKLIRIKEALLSNKTKIISGLVASALVACYTYKSCSNTGNLTEAKLGRLTKDQRIIVFQLKEKRMTDKDVDYRIALLLSIKNEIESAKKMIDKGEYTKAQNIIINVKGDIVILEKTKSFETKELRKQVDELRYLLGEKIKGESDKKTNEDED